MKIQIIKIGNSQGIRIPKPIMQQCELHNEVEMDVVNNKIIISAAEVPRSNWGLKFKEMAENVDDAMLLDDSAAFSLWDESEWEW